MAALCGTLSQPMVLFLQRFRAGVCNRPGPGLCSLLSIPIMRTLTFPELCAVFLFKIKFNIISSSIFLFLPLPLLCLSGPPIPAIVGSILPTDSVSLGFPSSLFLQSCSFPWLSAFPTVSIFSSPVSRSRHSAATFYPPPSPLPIKGVFLPLFWSGYFRSVNLFPNSSHSYSSYYPILFLHPLKASRLRIRVSLWVGSLFFPSRLPQHDHATCLIFPGASMILSVLMVYRL